MERKNKKVDVCCIPNPASIPHYKEVMAASFSKGIYNKPFGKLDNEQRKTVIKAIKEDIRENKSQMKEYK
jgi:hypothetical protein